MLKALQETTLPLSPALPVPKTVTCFFHHFRQETYNLQKHQMQRCCWAALVHISMPYGQNKFLVTGQGDLQILT